jgi:NAD+ synthetase
MKVMLAQIDPRIGDLNLNFGKAKAAVERAVKEGVDLVIFPELSITGYPPKDLLEKQSFVQAAWACAEKLGAMSTDKTGIIFGTPAPADRVLTVDEGKPLVNAACLAIGGRISNVVAKRLLPTYDVFDEQRYFQPGTYSKAVSMGETGYRIGLTICEDCWNDKSFWKERLYSVDPQEEVAKSGCDFFVNISASPFSLGKPQVRREMLSHIAKKYSKPFVYVNQVGGNDDVIYDGRSMVFDGMGNLCLQMKSFEEDCQIIDLEYSTKEIVQAPTEDADEETFKALVLGIKDYAEKTGFSKAVIALSGGIDSAVVAALACAAMGPENVLGVTMPSKFSSSGSFLDAQALAKALGMHCDLMGIAPIYESYQTALAPIIGSEQNERGKVKLWAENIQARIRGAAVMAISNDQNRLLLTTGNKSEVAVGYCTLYGDTCGGLAVIGDVFKCSVYSLARYINKVMGPVIPEATLTKAPSAELAPGQKDEDSLPPYPVLDWILHQYIEEKLEIAEIYSEALSLDSQMPIPLSEALIAKVAKMVDRNEYKRRQMAPTLKITKKAFGVGRQMPIAQGWH